MQRRSYRKEKNEVLKITAAKCLIFSPSSRGIIA